MKNIKLALQSILALTILCSCSAAPVTQFVSPNISALSNTPEGNIERLKQGNQRFINGQAVHPNQNAARLKEVAPKQHPFAIVVSCSDSRVPPEAVFDQGIGDLFVVRTAGHVVDSAAMASIEYAVEHLGARSIVIMGHESCGAVNAALNTPIGKSAGSQSLDSLVGAIRPHVSDFKANNAEDPKLRRPVTAHVDAVAQEIVESSPIIKEFVEQKNLYFARAIYSLESGEVAFWAEGYPEVTHTLANTPRAVVHAAEHPRVETKFVTTPSH